MSYYIILPSNSCPDTRPNNTASEFIVDLRNPLNLDGQWEVALTEFTFNSKFISIRKGSSYSYNRRTENPPVIKEESIFLKTGEEDFKEVQKFSLLNHAFITHYKTLHLSSQTEFEIKFKDLEIAKDWGFDSVSVKSVPYGTPARNQVVGKAIKKEMIDSSIVTVTYDMAVTYDSMKYIFEKDVSFNNVDDMVNHFKTDHKTVFKDFKKNSDREISFKLESNIKSLTLDDSLTMLLGFQQTIFDKSNNNVTDGYYTSCLIPKLRNGINHLYIYSNVLQNVVVGNHEVPLLKAIWLDKKYKTGDVVNVAIDHPMYLPASMLCINKIEVNIRDDGGNLIDFDYGSKTSLTLHFRKLN